MFKKLTLLAMAIGVAYAAPAAANAAQALTMPANTPVPKGTRFVATSTNTVWPTELGELTCPTVTLTGEVTENSGTTFAGKGTGTTSGQCFLVVGAKKEEIKITNIILSELMSTPPVGGVGQVDGALSFEMDISPSLTCKFHTPTAKTGDIATYVVGSSNLQLTNAPLEGGACGGMEMSGDYALATDPAGGGAVILD